MTAAVIVAVTAIVLVMVFPIATIAIVTATLTAYRIATTAAPIIHTANEQALEDPRRRRHRDYG